jgi:uncharacterized protein YpmB
MKKKIFIIIVPIIIIALIVLFAFPKNSSKIDKAVKTDKKVNEALEIIVFDNDVVKSSDLEFVKVDEKGRYVYKVKNKKIYYYVDLVTRSFEYSEY